MPAQSLDIVTAMIAVASWLVGAEVAAIVGPYSVIVLSALGGAAWAAASTHGTMGRGRTVLHIMLSVGLALIATVPLTELAAQWTGLEARWILAPVAAIIAARPGWLFAKVRAVVDDRMRAS